MPFSIRLFRRFTCNASRLLNIRRSCIRHRDRIWADSGREMPQGLNNIEGRLCVGESKEFGRQVGTTMNGGY